MKRFLVTAFGAALVALSACSQDAAPGTAHSVLERIRSERTIRVGYISFPPTVAKDPATGRLSGHFVDTVNEIADEAGWKVKFVETDWANFPAGLASGRFDISIAPTFATIPRALSVSFTRPLFYAGNSAIVRAGERRFSGIDSLDRVGVRIAVTAGEAGHEYVRRHFHNARIIVHSGADESLTFEDVLAGRADAALGDTYIVAKFAATHPGRAEDLFQGRTPYNLTPVAWAVPAGQTDLLNFLNTALETLEVQGKLAEFEKRHNAHWLHIEPKYGQD